MLLLKFIHFFEWIYKLMNGNRDGLITFVLKPLPPKKENYKNRFTFFNGNF